MNFKNETIIYKRKVGKLLQVMTREVIENSVDDEISELQNEKTKREDRIIELANIKNT